MTEREWVARCSSPSPTGAWPPPKGAAACSGRGVTTEIKMDGLWPVFIKCQHQRWYNSAMMLAILFLLKKNGVAPKWGCKTFECRGCAGGCGYLHFAMIHSLYQNRKSMAIAMSSEKFVVNQEVTFKRFRIVKVLLQVRASTHFRY